MGRLRRFLPLLLVLAALALVFAMGWNRYLSLDTVRDHGGFLRAYVAENYALSLLLLILIFAAMTASVVPGVVFLTVTAGYLFGPWVGGVATAFAATIGALGVYFVGRTALGETFRRRARQADAGLMRKICEGVDRDAFWYVLVARLVVSVPFHLINVAAGLVAAPIRPYALATFLGLLPAHVIYCWIGSGLNQVLAENPDPNLAALFSEFMWPLLGVAFLSILLPLILRLVRGRRDEEART
jgi:uncharacterized membrane protein YdjX (TVP38/TMEM64 family)